MMRTRLLWLIALSLAFMGLGPIYAQDGVVNLLTNGGLEDGTVNGFGGYGDNTREAVMEIVGAAIPEDVIEGSYCLHVVVNTTGENFYSGGVQPVYDGIFEKGKTYTLSAWLKCDEGTRPINFKPELAQDPWTGYGAQEITMTEEWAEYYITTPVMTEDVSPAAITFHIQYSPGEFWMDHVQFYEGDYVPTVFGPKVAPVNPGPADGTADVSQDVVLSWDPGVFAVTHDVYFGTSFDDVNNGDASVLASPGQAGTTFDPEGLLEFGQTYYWRVDEVNAPPDMSVFAGPVWSFTVEPFSYPIQNVTATASSAGTRSRTSSGWSAWFV